MEIWNAKSSGSRLVIVVLILMLHIVANSCFAESNNAPERPSFGNFIQQTAAIFKKSHLSPWDKMKSVVHQFQLQFFPPNLDFRRRDEAKSGQGMVDEMKDAVGKSFGASKDAVAGSAKSAAKVVEEAVDKVKENLADKDKDKDKDKDQHSHDEL